MKLICAVLLVVAVVFVLADRSACRSKRPATFPAPTAREIDDLHRMVTGGTRRIVRDEDGNIIGDAPAER